VSWGADWALYNLYLHSNRYLEIKDSIYLNHLSWHTNEGIKDETATTIQARFSKYQKIPEYNIDKLVRDVVPQQVDQLVTHLRRLEQKGV
jgi:hypothetical protein